MSDSSSPNSDDLEQVKLNQQSNPVQNPPTTQSTPVATQSSQDPPPLQETSHAVGVGKPNIGVELEEEKPVSSNDTITLSSPTIDIPGADNKKTPKTEETVQNIQFPKTDDNKISEIAAKNMPPNFKEEIKPVVEPELKPKIDLTPPVNPPVSTTPVPPVAVPRVSEQNIPIKTYDSNKTTDHTQPPVSAPVINVAPVNPPVNSNIPLQTPPIQPPTKSLSKGPAATITILAILALVFGGGGGFFGFKYYDKMKISASENISASPNTDTTTTSENGLKTYTNDFANFSLSYPNTWLINTENPQAEAIALASNAESLSGGTPTGNKIEITFEDLAGKTLKNFVDTKTTALNEKSEIKEIIVDEQAAYQQAQSNIRSAVVTFVERSEKAMLITYTAAEDKLTEGAEIYNNLINSIKLK